MLVYLDTSKMWWIIYRPDLHNLQTRRKKIKRVASSYKVIFCQCENQKYFQIRLLAKFLIMSEKCINYRPLKHQKRRKIVKGLN